MKFSTTPRTARHALAAAALVLGAAAAHAVPLVGLTSSNQLATFDTTNVAGTTTFVSITGLGSDRLVGIDLRPSNNLIYGVSLGNNVYTVNPTTGAATFVAALAGATINPTLGYGIDFNPVADASGAASLRLVSSNGDNYAVNANTGAVTVATSIAAGYSAVAYSAAVAGATTLYYVNSSTDTLASAPNNFNAPTVTTIGPLGIDVLRANGFDIVGGVGYGAFNVDAGTSLTTGIYTVSLTTGAATLAGTFNGTLSGLTSAPVPEPETYALMIAGLLAVGFMTRRLKGNGQA